MDELLAKCAVTDLLALVLIYSEPYKTSEAFRISLKYFVYNYPNKHSVKSVLLTELVEALGEELTIKEIESILD